MEITKRIGIGSLDVSPISSPDPVINEDSGYLSDHEFGSAGPPLCRVENKVCREGCNIERFGKGHDTGEVIV